MTAAVIKIVAAIEGQILTAGCRDDA